MSATVIDTLRYADRLKAAGFETPQAEGMARALADELADRMVTRIDRDDDNRRINVRFDALETKFDALETKFDARCDGLDARIDALETKCDKCDARFDGLDARIDALETKCDARFDGLDTKIDAVYRELSGKFNILLGVMALGFTLLASLGVYNAVSPRFGQSADTAPVERAANATTGSTASDWT